MQQIRLWNDYDERIFSNRYTMGTALIDSRHKFDTFVMYSKSMVVVFSPNPSQSAECHIQKEVEEENKQKMVIKF